MARESIRQGGRSARIQTAVHKAVDTLSREVPRNELTVPMIAERAGVPPSTIYRRWGDLSQLLADVAVRRMRPLGEPDDAGSMLADLEAWTLQYMEEMSSRVGRELLSDVLRASSEVSYSQKCCVYTYDQLNIIRDRAIARGEAGFDVDAIVDHVVAPIIYHILFGDRDLSPAYGRALVAKALADPTDL